MSLFENIERTHVDDRDLGESTYSFLNRSAQPGVGRTRKLLESWFEKVDAVSRNDLQARFRSRDDQFHEGAFFELFLHELLTRLGFVIDIHPNIKGGSKHPDFLARHPDGGRFYLEATVVGELSGPFTRSANEQDVIDKLNTLTSSHFRIGVHMDGELLRTLARKDVIPPFQELMNAYTTDEVKHKIDAGRMYAAPSQKIKCGNWTLEGWLVPNSAQDRSIVHSPQLVMEPYRAMRTDSVSRVKKALMKKAGNYGPLDAPLIVAVNARDMFYNGKRNDKEMLFGKEQLVYSGERLDSSAHIDRIPDGLWSQNSKIDAVMRFQRVDFWNLINATVCLYTNPQKTNLVLSGTLFRLPHAELRDGHMKWFEGEDITHLVGVNRN